VQVPLRSSSLALSSSSLGHGPLKAETRVRFPLGSSANALWIYISLKDEKLVRVQHRAYAPGWGMGNPRKMDSLTLVAVYPLEAHLEEQPAVDRKVASANLV
jgi:hypothetical protein